MAWVFKTHAWNSLRRRGPLVLSFLAGIVLSMAVSSIRNPGQSPSDLRRLFSLSRERRAKHDAQSPVHLKKNDTMSSWLTFEVVGDSRLIHESGGQVLMRQREEGLLCAKIADALESCGETSLSEQVWEQTRRILCVEDVAAAKERIRELLMLDGGR
jgi:hypothetical protein